MNNSNSRLKEPSPSSSQRNSLDTKTRIMEMKPQSLDRLILGHLDIRSIRTKFDGLRFIIDNKTDILLISETILDDAFPTFSIFNRRI